jgi:hypothetical protein
VERLLQQPDAEEENGSVTSSQNDMVGKVIDNSKH